MQWDVPKIIQDNGGAMDLAASLNAAGYDVSVRAVRQWLRRDNIPSDWIAKIIHLHEPVSIQDWVRTGTPLVLSGTTENMEDIF